MDRTGLPHGDAATSSSYTVQREYDTDVRTITLQLNKITYLFTTYFRHGIIRY